MAGFGETLHQARAHLGVSLKEAEQATRINRHHLAALEEEHFAALPPVIYQRGIVRNYAVHLKLDPGKVLAMFEDAHGAAGAPNHGGGVASVPPIDMPGHWAPNFAIIAFAAVLSAIVFAWVYSAFVAETDPESTPPVAVPTATPYDEDIPWPTQPPAIVTPSPRVTKPAQTEDQSAADPSTSTRRSGGDNQVEGSANETTPPPTEPPTEPPADTSAGQTDEAQDTTSGDNQVDGGRQTGQASGNGQTSISITAISDIYVTVVADGDVVFDGNLAAGEATDNFAGSEFSVTTSSGINTLFTNACGDQFQMGYEEGEAIYDGLKADENSCDPLPN